MTEGEAVALIHKVILMIIITMIMIKRMIMTQIKMVIMRGRMIMMIMMQEEDNL